MKKVFAFILCVGMLFATATATFADINHYEDGHHTITLDEYEISLEIPTEWKYLQLDDMYAMYPDGTSDIIYLLSFADYGEDELNNALKNIFLTTAADNCLTGMTGEDQEGSSEIMALSNENEVAAASFFDEKYSYTSSATTCGEQIIILGFRSTIDKFENEYIDDLDSILSSAKEI